jgi:hypothetical protein
MAPSLLVSHLAKMGVRSASFTTVRHLNRVGGKQAHNFSTTATKTSEPAWKSVYPEGTNRAILFGFSTFLLGAEMAVLYGLNEVGEAVL